MTSLIRRTRELGLTTEISTRRAYQRLAYLQTTGLLRPEPITTYPGETPTLISNAFALAEQHSSLTLSDLAEELAWPIRTVRTLLSNTDSRPTLTLVRDP